MPEPTPVLPHVAAQIAALPKSSRPLVICDVDEVILHLISHLEIYLAEHDMHFLDHNYRFIGNIVHRQTQEPLPSEVVRQHLQMLFDRECHQQHLVDGASEALNALWKTHDVVLLTNLPGDHNKPAREKLLAEYDLRFPVLTNSGPKGGAVAALSAGRPSPVVFIDDSPANHSSVKASLPSAKLVQFIADKRFLAAMPKAPHIDLLTGNWGETHDFIVATLENA
ncbi:MAG: hypothetical protein HWE23_01985 [Rhodobacteraceae bacterium]|nr:hypothetical protein [Paracoccaceae bacterium]